MHTGALRFKTITVATDLGDSASSALRYSQAIARQHQSTLVLVHVIDPVGYAFPEGTPAWLDADQAAREELARIEEETRQQGIPVHSVVETGIVCERIVQAVKDNHSDLLVLGTRGKTEAGRAALGMVARQLLAKAPCPILTVSPDADVSLPWAGRWHRVLAGTDFSAVSVSALLRAHQMAHKELIALHVSRCQREDECFQCLERLRFLAPFNESHTVPVEHIVKSGDANDLIPEYAWKLHADLVVLGSPANVLTGEELGTSTVMHVISKVKCPVLCVPMSTGVSNLNLIREVAVAH
jgi:nucleotide-binding universal stress UspA family protein